MKSSKEIVKRGPSPKPFVSSSKKLDQIRLGTRERKKTREESKDFVFKGKDGSKITSKVTQKKFEETAVLRKKRNYVMYESKLGTEKDTQIKVESKRQPSPRIEEKIKITKKRKDYLDNYQYKESRVYRNPKKKRKALVEHIRLGEIIDGFYETTTYESQVIRTGDNHPRLKGNKTTTTLFKTYNNGFKDNKQDKTNNKRSASSRSLNNPNQDQKYTSTTTKINRRTTSNNFDNKNSNYNTITNIPPRGRKQIKSDIITNQIMPSRNRPKPQPEYQINTYNPENRKSKEQPKKIEQNSIKNITRTIVKKDDNNLRNSNSRRRIEPANKITSVTINKRNTRDDNPDKLRPKTPKVKEVSNFDTKQPTKSTKKFDVVKLDNNKKPKTKIELIKYEKKEEKKPKKIVEVVKIEKEEKEEKKPKKIVEVVKIEREEKKPKKLNEVVTSEIQEEKKIVKKKEIIIEDKKETKTEIIVEKKEVPKKIVEVTIEREEIVQPGKKKSIRNKYKALH